MEPGDVRRFLEALDAALGEYADEGKRLDLYLIGRSALILRYGLTLATKDMVQRTGDPELEQKALMLFGVGTANATTWGLYLQAVPQGLPPVPADLLPSVHRDPRRLEGPPAQAAGSP